MEMETPCPTCNTVVTAYGKRALARVSNLREHLTFDCYGDYKQTWLITYTKTHTNTKEATND